MRRIERTFVFRQECAGEKLMKYDDDDCIWLRTDVMLDTGDGSPTQVQTRKLCRSGVFLEYTGPVKNQSVEIVFPEPYSPEDGCRLFGVVTRRWPDGLWIRFRNDLRSAAEMMMRHGPQRFTRAPRMPQRPAYRL
jgi:hypothetical protein